MMTRNDIMRITSLIICILIIPVHTTDWEQDNTIEFLLRRVAELETNQQKCNSYQRNMILELTYVKNKLQESERRISELEVIVYNMKSDAYNGKMNLTMQDDPVDQPTNETVTKCTKEDKNTNPAQGRKRMHPAEPGIARREKRGIAVREIAFCTTIADDVNVQIRANEIIHFNTVLHNEGNGYSKETGFFTCPMSGTYFFSASLMSSHGHITFVHLIVNGQIKGNSYADGANSYDQGSISSIMRCEAGQNVWISVNEGTQLYGNYYTSFSGFLLWGESTGSR